MSNNRFHAPCVRLFGVALLVCGFGDMSLGAQEADGRATGGVVGRVNDARTGQPIVGAQIYLADQSAETISNGATRPRLTMDSSSM